MRHHPFVVQCGAPAHQRLTIGFLVKARHQRPDQQLLHQTHVGMRRHFKTAKLQQPQPSGCRVRGIHLVHAELGTVGITGNIRQQITQQPINQPGFLHIAGRHLRQGNFQLIQSFVTGLINPWRLTGRANKHAREQV